MPATVNVPPIMAHIWTSYQMALKMAAGLCGENGTHIKLYMITDELGEFKIKYHQQNAKLIRYLRNWYKQYKFSSGKVIWDWL